MTPNAQIQAAMIALAARHQTLADQFNKRRVCVAGEFHAYTADTLTAAARALAEASA